MNLKSLGAILLLSNISTGSLASEFVKVPEGQFHLGTYKEHVSVKVTKPFYIAKSEVTLGEFNQYKPAHKNKKYTECDASTCPVSNIGYGDTLKYIEWFNKKNNTEARLCTEAEWSYAQFKGGDRSRACNGKRDCMDDIAWYENNSGYRVHPVNEKPANSLGVYDMSGNVWEYTSSDYCDLKAPVDQNLERTCGGKEKVLRGGGYMSKTNTFDGFARIGKGLDHTPENGRSIYDLGFRMCSSKAI